MPHRLFGTLLMSGFQVGEGILSSGTIRRNGVVVRVKESCRPWIEDVY